MNFYFEGFHLDAAKRQLFGPDGADIELHSRAFDLLHYMVKRPGEMLDKSELLKAVWPTTVVEENNLSQGIFLLRRALGDTASEHRFITTVPGRGYQFVAKVRTRGSEDTPPAQTETGSAEPGTGGSRLHWALTGIAGLLLAAVAGWMFWPNPVSTLATSAGTPDTTPAASTSSIAVLPFADLSPARDMEYFTDGMAEELMNGLANVSSLRVVGRSSAFAFKGTNIDARGIGEKLKVENVLEGSVRKDGDRIRITAQLVRTRDGISVWSNSYDRQLDSVLDVQGSIAREVVGALSPVISPTSPDTANAAMAQTQNVEAYNAYLRGLYLARRSTIGERAGARDQFRRAVELDPDFAIAHARLAQAYANIARTATGDIVKNRSLAAEHLDRALKLDPSLADLWWIRLWPLTMESTSLALREMTAEQALASSPHDPGPMTNLSGVYWRLGRQAEAADLVERAYQADPLWPTAIWNLALTEYTFRGNRQRAVELIDELAAVSSDHRAPDMHAQMAFIEGRALDWDRWSAKAVEASLRRQATHGYLAQDYGHLGLLDAALYHARVSGEVNNESAGGDFNFAHVHLFVGDVAAARPFVQRAMAEKPDDYLAQLALAQLQYFTGDCRGAVRMTELARPPFAQPEGSIDLVTDVPDVPILVWCLRQVGNAARVKLLMEVFERQLPPGLPPGVFDGVQARVAAAAGDRESLVAHLRRLVDSNSMRFAFVRHEPMIQEYLADPEVKRLLDVLDARYAEWRRIIPKSSMKVPIPDAPGRY
jgi:TolB-like protein/DNA-binding winged helix-turn-helix (wHTH) protein/tetratricopeptide (TPR) repeat protein